MPRPFRAFICSAHKDIGFVDRLVPWLRKRYISPNSINLRLRLDKNISAFPAEVSPGELGDIVLAIISANFLEDDWLPRELIAFLVREKGTDGIPVRVLKLAEFAGVFPLDREAEERSFNFAQSEPDGFEKLDNWLKDVRPPLAGRVFISHSTKDRDLAKAIAKLLEAGLQLKKQEIRCTSVAEFQLPPGSDYAVALCREIRDADIFLALATEDGLTSPWVLFELGARWGTQRFCQPLLARGGSAEALPPPIERVQAINLAEAAQLQHLVGELARKLQLQSPDPSQYQSTLNDVEKLAQHQRKSQED